MSETKKKFYIHRSLLVEHSEYFQKAFNGPWKEAQEGVVTLEDVDCNTCKAWTPLKSDELLTSGITSQHLRGLDVHAKASD
jgi:hypothetical protein